MNEPMHSGGMYPGDPVVARLGQHWGWVFGYGLLTLIAGIAVAVWPTVTLLVVAVLFGIQLIVYGIFRFVSALMIHGAGVGTRILLALLGVLSLIIGLWAVRHADVTLVLLAVFLGIYWIVNGTIELFTAFEPAMPNRGWTAAMGVLSIIAGLVVLAYPGISLFTLAVFLGIWLVVLGVMEIASAFRLRSAAHAASHRIAHAH
ncbi:MAG: DUF308 domain-containing protein [Streptosporangiaceae bacterium]|nr:DUF308 domain-containing protein [Streptosporangiaceae bacterium]MBV9858105.1 DUF308 domain-containing protein [Streptosporangiaceae bacterium]